MNNKIPFQSPPLASPGLTTGDIYYVLFRHKWKIILCSLAGFAAAVVVFVLNPPPFSSEAKLFVRYVVTESKTPTPAGTDNSVKSPDQGGETIMASEREILTSLDLATRVAQAIGPEKILARINGGRDLNFAAVIVNAGLKVDAPPRSSVIRIVFTHPDGSIVQPVMREVVSQYLKMHIEIHRAVGILGDFLIQETDQLRNRLAQTEEDLRKARNRAGIISLDETKETLSAQRRQLQNEIFAAEAELAEKMSLLAELTKQTPGSAPLVAEQPSPIAKVNEYRSIATRLELLQKREQELLAQFTEENARVKEIRLQIVAAARAKQKLEDEFPGLIRTNPVPSFSGGGTFDVATETARINALKAKMNVFSAQMEGIQAKSTAIDLVEGSILELERQKGLEEANYRHYAASLEQSRINEALGTGKVSNISPIQAPSPPYTEKKKTLKLVGAVAFAGIGLALAWSFFTEFYLDRTVRRPIDVERLLGVPLFLSIPVIGKVGKLRRLKSAPKPLELPSSERGNIGVPATIPSKAGDPGGLENEGGLVLQTFHETLRDRLISYFESVNLTHKPKLVAVTGLGHGSGVTTTAAGLARSLSETGEGNVLLVDMTAGQGSAQQFYRGRDIVGLEEILSTRDDAQVQDKLYVVSEEPGQEKLSRILPQRFTKLIPKLKASNFDYIIFDMPPVSQISITPRLAGFMDMVLMIIESEKTDRDLVQRATTLLAQSNAHVGAVLNKSKNYVPSRLHEEYLGNG